MSRSKHLLVIDPSVEHPETEGCGEVLEGWPGTSRVLQPALRPGDGPVPETGYEADGVVLMGSAASALDHSLPWLDDLRAWLRPLVTGEVVTPVLGICFGHQLLAALAGGEVGFGHGDHHKEVGVQHTELTGGRLLPGRHRLQVVVSHCEVVHHLPPHLRCTGTRPGAAIDSFEHELLPLFGVQFHPEARGEFCRRCHLDFDAVAQRVRSDGRLVLQAFRDRALKAP